MSNTDNVLVRQSGVFVSSESKVAPARLEIGTHHVTQRRNNLSVVVISCLRLVRMPNLRNGEALRVTRVDHSLGTLTGRLGIPIITLSRLGQALRDHPSGHPVGSSLERSKSVRRSTSLVVFVCHSRICCRSDGSGKATRVVVNGREGNPVNGMELAFRNRCSQFSGFTKPSCSRCWVLLSTIENQLAASDGTDV